MRIVTQSGRRIPYVLLTDLAGLDQLYAMPNMGLVPLAQVELPSHNLHPVVEGTGAGGNGLIGTWRARADKVISWPAARYQTHGPVTSQELEAIEDAVRLFLGL